MTFKKGQSGNPAGKPKGAVSGITRAKTIILEVFERHSPEFKKQLNEAASKNPIGFYLKFVQPFMPKDLNLAGDLNVNESKKSRSDMLALFSEIEAKIAKKTARNDKAGS